MKDGLPGQVILSQDRGTNWLCVDEFTGSLKTELMLARGGRALTAQTAITDGDWHRVGLTWDGQNRCLYVDDVMVANDMQINLPQSLGRLFIGAGKQRDARTFWSGLIDDVRIYNRTMTP